MSKKVAFRSACAVAVTEKAAVVVAEDCRNYDKRDDSFPSVVAKEATTIVVYKTRYLSWVDSLLLKERKESIK